MRTILLVLGYDGTDFKGWQVQPGQPSIQAEMMRDNIEGLLQSFRRLAEASVRLSEDAANSMTAGTERAPETDARH